MVKFAAGFGTLAWIAAAPKPAGAFLQPPGSVVAPSSRQQQTVRLSSSRGSVGGSGSSSGSRRSCGCGSVRRKGGCSTCGTGMAAGQGNSLRGKTGAGWALHMAGGGVDSGITPRRDPNVAAPIVPLRFTNMPDGQDVTVTVKEGDNVFRAAKAAGVKIATSCQSGLCGTCESDMLDPYWPKGQTYRPGWQVIRTCVAGAVVPRGCSEMVIDVYRGYWQEPNTKTVKPEEAFFLREGEDSYQKVMENFDEGWEFEYEMAQTDTQTIEEVQKGVTSGPGHYSEEVRAKLMELAPLDHGLNLADLEELDNWVDAPLQMRFDDVIPGLESEAAGEKMWLREFGSTEPKDGDAEDPEIALRPHMDTSNAAMEQQQLALEMFEDMGRKRKVLEEWMDVFGVPPIEDGDPVPETMEAWDLRFAEWEQIIADAGHALDKPSVVKDMLAEDDAELIEFLARGTDEESLKEAMRGLSSEDQEIIMNEMKQLEMRKAAEAAEAQGGGGKEGLKDAGVSDEGDESDESEEEQEMEGEADAGGVSM